MSRLSRIFMVMAMLVSVCCSTVAQKQVKYYKYVKSIYLYKNKVDMAKSELGQFITRNGDYCYESDKYGNSVGHGIMKLTARKGNSVKYVGSSYYGSGSHFTFFDDKGVLNVEANGFVYVYKLSTPPPGVTTCSFISGGETGNPYAAPTAPSVSTSGTSGSNTKSKPAKQYNKWEATTVYDPCPRCGRSGKCPACKGSGKQLAYGNRHLETCSTCHGSGRCPTCNGSGQKARIIRGY